MVSWNNFENQIEQKNIKIIDSYTRIEIGKYKKKKKKKSL